MSPYERLLQLLSGVGRRGRQATALCPAHPDHRPSLSITEADDGRVLMKCHAGCPVETIVTSIGLRMSDLFPTAGHRSPRRQRTAQSQAHAAQGGGSPRSDTESNTRTPREGAGLTLADYADAKKLPEAFLRVQGLSAISWDGHPALRIPYLDRHGEEVAVRFRIALEGATGFRWRVGAKPCLYGLWRIGEAREKAFVVLAEGESDVQTLWFHGIPALGLPGAATWREKWADELEGMSTVFVVVEPDSGGEAVLGWLARSRIRDRARLVSLRHHKDPSALHIADPDGFDAAWNDAVQAAVPWAQHEENLGNLIAGEAFQLAAGLLHDPDILDRVGEAMRERGYAGDLRAPELAYVAITSRLLERPMNLAFVAQSAAGKNRAINAAVELMPPDAVHLVSASSPRALIYSDEDFQHRTVVVAEADSIPDDGPAASAIRSIAEDYEMIYEVVERDPQSDQHRTRRVVKRGPTGLITTSTRTLRTQLGTRHLEVAIPDDPTQVQAVLQAHARAVSGPTAPLSDIAPFIAVQQWLRLAGVRRIQVPFAGVLARCMPTTAVRMNRDFKQLLTCVQTVAFLRQCQRGRTSEGAVIAELDDYAAARTLLGSIFDAIAQGGLTPVIRDTVQAVRVDEVVTETELARRLNRSKATVSHRVRCALKEGWLVNGEGRRGYPARLSRGAPLPDATTGLPSPRRVLEVFECSSPTASTESPPPPPSNEQAVGGDAVDNTAGDPETDGDVTSGTERSDSLSQ